MKIMKYLLILTIFLFTIIPVQAINISVCASGCDYTTIQAGINAATNGDIIDIRCALCTEQLTVNKKITLIGNVSGEYSYPILNNGISPSINITADNVTIKHLYIEGASNEIKIDANNTVIEDNIFDITSYGIVITLGNNQVIHNNTFYVKVGTISVECTPLECGNNLIMTNNFVTQYQYGVYDPKPFYLTGINNYVAHNTFDGYNTVTPGTGGINPYTIGAGSIIEYNLFNVTYYGLLGVDGVINRNNIVKNSIYAAFNLELISNSVFINNTFDGVPSWSGYMEESVNNTFIRNTIISNADDIIFYIYYNSHDNKIYDNIFNVTTNPITIDYADFEPGHSLNNTWSNPTLELGWNVKGRLYIGGNYWTNPTGTGYSDTCADTEGWGRCESYIIDANNTDYYPISTKTYRYVTNSAGIIEIAPSTSFPNGFVAMTDWQNYGNEYRYLLETNITESANNGGYVMLKAESANTPYYLIAKNISSFNENTVTWNNQPSPGNSISQQHDSIQSRIFLPFYFSSTTQYISFGEYQNQFYTGYFDSYTDDAINITDRPYIEMLLPLEESGDTFTATGNVKFIDIDLTLINLPGALVYFNSTLNTTTDSNGNYSINIPNGQQTLYVVKSNAYTNTSGIVNEYSSILNFQLSYSKPVITNVIVSGNYFKGTYSHNFKTLTLWENPNFVWGRYYFEDLKNTSNDKYYFKQCIYSGSNIFLCDFIINRNYTFEFVYSDKYNSNLAFYHPTLIGIRNFTTPIFYVISGTNYQDITSIKSLSLLSQNEREETLKNAFPDFVFWLIVMLIVFVIFSFGSKK